MAALVVPDASARPSATLARVDHVADGDTLTLTNGRRVRLVQIDTPEVYFHPECYGRRASRIAKRMLPPGRWSASPPSRQPIGSIGTGGFCATSSAPVTGWT
jgi:endonuclease YncB( thermonuclease family)